MHTLVCNLPYTLVLTEVLPRVFSNLDINNITTSIIFLGTMKCLWVKTRRFFDRTEGVVWITWPKHTFKNPNIMTGFSTKFSDKLALTHPAFGPFFTSLSRALGEFEKGGGSMSIFRG